MSKEKKLIGIVKRYNNFLQSSATIRKEWRKIHPNCSFVWYPNCKNWRSVSIRIYEV